MKTPHRTVLLLTAVCTFALGYAVYAGGNADLSEEPEITEEESRTLADLIQPPLPAPAPRAVESKSAPLAPAGERPAKEPVVKKPLGTRTALLQ